jgi:hypothetical protein
MPDESDPSALTTAALLREVAHLKEAITVRLDATDRALATFQDNLTRVPTEVQKEVGHLREFHDQKFVDIENQLRERSDRRTAEKAAAQEALAAALQAAKELSASQDAANATALDKSQASIDRRLSDLAKLFETSIASVRVEIADLKSRLDKGEGSLGGERGGRTDRRLDTSLFVSIGALILAVLIAAASFLK